MKLRTRKLYLGVEWSNPDDQYTIRLVLTSPETYLPDTKRYLEYWGSGDQKFQKNRFSEKSAHQRPKTTMLT